MDAEEILRELCITHRLVPRDATKWSYDIQCQEFISVTYMHCDARICVEIPLSMRPLFYFASSSIWLKGMAFHFDSYEPMYAPGCLTKRDHFYLIVAANYDRHIIGVNYRDDYMARQWWIYQSAYDSCHYIGGRDDAQKLYETFFVE